MTPEQTEKIFSLPEAIEAKLGASSNPTFCPNPNLDNAVPASASAETYATVVGAP